MEIDIPTFGPKNSSNDRKASSTNFTKFFLVYQLGSSAEMLAKEFIKIFLIPNMQLNINIII